MAGVDKDIIEYSLKSEFKDFEDAIQEYASRQNNVEIIITRNVTDFNKSSLIIVTPKQFIEFMEEKRVNSKSFLRNNHLITPLIMLFPHDS